MGCRGLWLRQAHLFDLELLIGGVLNSRCVDELALASYSTAAQLALSHHTLASAARIAIIEVISLSAVHVKNELLQLNTVRSAIVLGDGELERSCRSI